MVVNRSLHLFCGSPRKALQQTATGSIAKPTKTSLHSIGIPRGGLPQAWLSASCHQHDKSGPLYIRRNLLVFASPSYKRRLSDAFPFQKPVFIITPSCNPYVSVTTFSKGRFSFEFVSEKTRCSIMRLCTSAAVVHGFAVFQAFLTNSFKNEPKGILFMGKSTSAIKKHNSSC